MSPIPVNLDKHPVKSGYTGRDGKWVGPKTIASWIKAYGDSNIAIRLPKDVICLDVDDYKGHAGGATLASLEAELGKLPDTIRSTARWGWGVSGIKWFRIPEAYHGMDWPGQAGPGIDILCWYERYAIVPPSYHTGVKAEYKWYSEADGSVIAHLDTLDGLPELPEAWCEYLGHRSTAGAKVDVGSWQDWLKDHTQDGVMCGQMLATAGRWAEQIADAEDVGGVHDSARDGVKAVLGDCAAGHTGAWLALGRLFKTFNDATAARSRRRRASSRPEWRRLLSGAVGLAAAQWTDAEDPCYTLEQIQRTNPAKVARAGKLLKGRQDGGWLDDQRFKPLVWAIEQIVPEGLAVLAGPPKIGKSMLMLRFALEVARGGDVFGIELEERPVFYLALEDSARRLQARSWELLGDDPIPGEFQFQTEISPGKLTETVDAWLDQTGHGLVLVDTLGRAMEPPQNGETTYDRDYRIVVNLKSIADAHNNSSVVVSHHSKKGKSDDWLEIVSGTNAITGAADTILVIARERGAHEGILRVSGRDVDDKELSLTIEHPFGWALDGADLLEAAQNAEARKNQPKSRRESLGDLSQGIMDYLDENGESPINDIASAIGAPIDKTKVYLGRLWKSGHIDKPSRGTYGPFKKSRIKK